jgi:hypothetical protein
LKYRERLCMGITDKITSKQDIVKSCMKNGKLNGDGNAFLFGIMGMWKKQSFSHIPTDPFFYFLSVNFLKNLPCKGGGSVRRAKSSMRHFLERITNINLTIALLCTGGTK